MIELTVLAVIGVMSLGLVIRSIVSHYKGNDMKIELTLIDFLLGVVALGIVAGTVFTGLHWLIGC